MKKTNIIKLFIHMLLAFLICNIALAGAEEDRVRLIYKSNRNYLKVMKKLNYNEADALKILENAVKEMDNVYYSREAIMLVGDEYFFYSDLDKLSIPLTGYYVNGNTGSVFYRKSNKSVHKDKWLPKEAFISENCIRSEPKGARPNGA
jgi:hypothetical protein